MSIPSWRKLAIQTLSCLAPTDQITIIGVGTELRGDDAVGVEIARRLRRRISNPNCQVIEAGPAPENFTSTLRQRRPKLVLIIDAAQMEAPPGTVRWLTPAELAELPAATHALPLDLFARFIQQELGCQVALIGIQPQQTDFQAPLTKAVQLAAKEVVEVIAGIYQA
jgi:hydrogenase 3 maturation protease